MLKKTIKFTDYNGVERTEDFFFNLNKAEIAEMEMSYAGGLTTYINRIIAAQDNPTLVKLFKDLILMSYGVKSDDGREFVKNDEIRNKFKHTEAYSILFMELSTNADSAAEFVTGIIPKDLAKDLPDPKTIVANTPGLV